MVKLNTQWIGFSWDNLNRKPSIFPWNSWGFPVNYPLNQSIEHIGGLHKKHCFKGGSDREQKSTLNEWSLRNHWQFKSSQLSIQCRRLLNLLSLKPRDRGQLVFFGTIQWINLKFQTLPTSENPLPGLWWLLACQWWSTATLQHLSGRGRPFQYPTGMWGDAWSKNVSQLERADHHFKAQNYIYIEFSRRLL